MGTNLDYREQGAQWSEFKTNVTAAFKTKNVRAC